MAGSRKRAAYDGGSSSRAKRTYTPRYKSSYPRESYQAAKKKGPNNMLLNQDKKAVWVQMPWATTVANTAIAASSSYLSRIGINDMQSCPYMGSDEYFALFTKAYIKRVEGYVAISCNTSSAELHCNVWIDNENSDSASLAQSTQRCIAHGGTHKTGYYGANQFNQGMKFDVNQSAFALFKTGMGEPDNTQVATVAPVNKMYMHIEVWNGTTALAGDATGLQIDMVLKADCGFWDPKTLAVSA